MQVLLKLLLFPQKKVVGILPTEEECERVSATAELTGIEIVQGRTDSINTAILRFGYPDLIYCNSVLHGLGFDASAVKASFAHFSNNQKKNGLLYVREIPQTDEMVGRNYGLSFKKYIWWCISKARYRSAMANLWQFFRALLTNHVYVIQEQNMFHASPALIEKLGLKYGYQLLAVCHGDSGQQVPSPIDLFLGHGRPDCLFKKYESNKT